MKFIPHIAFALIAVVLVAADKKPEKAKSPTWFKIVNRKSGRCLAVERVLKKDGASIVEQKLSKDSLDQQWKLQTVGNDYFWIINRISGHYLSVTRGSKDKRTSIVQQPFNETDQNQQWGFSPVTLNRGNVFVRLVNGKDEHCIGVHSKSKKEAAIIAMSPADESHDQHWQIVQVKSSSAKTKKDSVKTKADQEFTLYEGFKKDQALLTKTVPLKIVNAKKDTVNASSGEACQAARRIFNRVSFLFKTRKGVLKLLGDPATISEYNQKAKDDPNSPLVYFFGSGFGGYRYTLKFRNGKCVGIFTEGIN